MHEFINWKNEVEKRDAEIARMYKARDRVIERLEEESYHTQPTFDEDGYCNDDSELVVDFYEAIEIIKEEMGYD